MLKRLLTVCAALIILFSGIGLMTTAKPTYRLSSLILTHWTSQIDESFFLLLMNLENRSFAHYNDQLSLTPSLVNEIFKRVTNIRLNDMTSFLGQEIPGFSTYERTVIIAGEGLDNHLLSHESSPPLDDVFTDHDVVGDEGRDDVEQTEDSFPSTGKDEVVFLYNTHNRESFLPHLKGVKDPNLAHHDHVNVMNLSERLQESLYAKGIGTSID